LSYGEVQTRSRFAGGACKQLCGNATMMQATLSPAI
jgi:hypothetical protein